MTASGSQRPFENTRFAKFIDAKIEDLKPVKSQREIAFELGYNQPNILSMIKRGETKMPLDKVPALAAALDVDAAHLMRMALEDYLPALAAAFEESFGHVATRNEHELLLAPWRTATADSDPQPSPHLKLAIEGMLTQLSPQRRPK